MPYNFCVFSYTIVSNRLEENMKKLLIGIALGMAAGYVVGNMPEVRNLVNKGKKKVRDITK